MRHIHLAILKKPYLEAILEGRKKVESRFSRTRRGYFESINPQDKVFFKVSSGPVRGVATIDEVRSFCELRPIKMQQLKEQYNHLILGSEEYWQSKLNCKFGLLLWLKEVKEIEPINISKRDWRAWVVLTEKENYGLFKRESEPQE